MMMKLKKTALLLISIAASTQLMAAEFYVTPSSSDQNPGTSAKPFKTIAHARD